jgi:acetylornithine deacetylase/succinyl-diaminopimelate desuccinylase-like protein
MDKHSVREEAVGLLQDLIRVDTSNPPGRETPAATLLKDYLEAAGVECELVARDPDRANLVARIRGTGGGPTFALTGHTDVVPAHAPDWARPPFGGHLDEDGYVWGRGAADMKNETATRAVTMAMLAREDFRPRGDLLFIAQADEEDGTEAVGMSWLVGARPDLRPDYALDEGGGERLELADGRVVYPINIGEKATLAAMVTAVGEAGHASMPDTGANAVPLLATLIGRLAAHRPEPRLLPAVRATLEALVGPLDGDVRGALSRAVALHPALAAQLPPLLGATIAPTRLYGSDARNVMPGRAAVECDCRVLPGDGPADLERELRAALGDDVAYELEFLEEPNGGTIAPLDTPLMRICQGWLDEVDAGASLLPKVSTGFTDSHFLRQAFGTVSYGFWPVRATPLDVYMSGFHNKDERIHSDDLVDAVGFHLHVCREMGRLEGRGPAG